MPLKNTISTYGSIAILVHWTVAFAVVGLFVLGLWMVDLNYYSPWYHDAPAIHKAIGVLLFLVMGFRLVWRLVNRVPLPEPGQKVWEIKAAETTHVLLYILIFTVIASGYLISTAEGKPIDVFGLMSVPALISGLPKQADVAGWVHFILAVGLIGFSALHALAALKHHFIDRDLTLKRMLGLKKGDGHSSQSLETTTETHL